jgi:hypothetical protein
MGKNNNFKANQNKGNKIAPPIPSKEVSDLHKKPIFSLVHLQKDYCLSKCDKKEKAAFADTLHKLSQMTWQDILFSPKHGSGSEKISRNSIQTTIPDHLTEDVKFLAIRFCAKAPMVGYREQNIFQIIWIDRSFSLYDHG